MRLDDHIELINQIGSGGMGNVWKARHTKLETDVAVKLMHSHLFSPERLKRFQAEAKLASELSHPNIVRILKFGLSADLGPYIVMEFIEGCTLADKLQSGPLRPDFAKEIWLQAAKGLQYAHEHNVIHRDIKPSNILLSSSGGEQSFVKISDFGIAKHLSQGSIQQLTQTGEILGSPAYMSPELCCGARVDARSDIYSFGCVMYECLTGKQPFEADTPVELMMAQVHQKAPEISQKNVPNGWSQIIGRTLEKNPDSRQQSMQELQEELLSGRPAKAPSAVSSTKLPLVSSTLRREFVAPVAMLILLAVAGAAYFFTNTAESASEHRRAVEIAAQDPNFVKHRKEIGQPLENSREDAGALADSYYEITTRDHGYTTPRELSIYAQLLDLHDSHVAMREHARWDKLAAKLDSLNADDDRAVLRDQFIQIIDRATDDFTRQAKTVHFSNGERSNALICACHLQVRLFRMLKHINHDDVGDQHLLQAKELADQISPTKLSPYVMEAYLAYGNNVQNTLGPHAAAPYWKKALDILVNPRSNAEIESQQPILCSHVYEAWNTACFTGGNFREAEKMARAALRLLSAHVPIAQQEYETNRTEFAIAYLRLAEALEAIGGSAETREAGESIKACADNLPVRMWGIDRWARCLLAAEKAQQWETALQIKEKMNKAIEQRDFFGYLQRPNTAVLKDAEKSDVAGGSLQYNYALAMLKLHEGQRGEAKDLLQSVNKTANELVLSEPFNNQWTIQEVIGDTSRELKKLQ